MRISVVTESVVILILGKMKNVTFKMINNVHLGTFLREVKFC